MLSIGIHCEHSSDEKVKREVTIDLPRNGTVGSAALKSMTALVPRRLMPSRRVGATPHRYSGRTRHLPEPLDFLKRPLHVHRVRGHDGVAQV
jgi:hypothetical protein